MQFDGFSFFCSFWWQRCPRRAIELAEGYQRAFPQERREPKSHPPGSGGWFLILLASLVGENSPDDHIAFFLFLSAQRTPSLFLIWAAQTFASRSLRSSQNLAPSTKEGKVSF